MSALHNDAAATPLHAGLPSLAPRELSSRQRRQRGPCVRLRPARARGSIYILVLATATMLAIGGLGAIAVARLQVRKDQQRLDSERAAELAIAGVHAALAYANSTPNWRDEFSKVASPVTLELNGERVRWMILDERGGRIGLDPEPCQIIAVGETGTARRVYSVTASPPADGPLSVLECALYANGNIESNGTLDALGPVATPLNIDNNGDLNADVQASTFRDQGTHTGDATVPALPRRLPSVDNTFAATAITISYAGIPANRISGVALTATNNPYGLPSVTGKYAIAVPGGRTLTIHDARLQASLVVFLNSGASLVVSGEVLWEPASTDLPALVVVGKPDASVTFQSSNLVTLSESAESKNFNPLLAPYIGVSDLDTADEYASELRGVYYISTEASLTITNNQRIVGCVAAAGPVTLGDASLVNDPGLLAIPPDLFDEPDDTLSVDAGSWRWRSYDDVASIFDR